MHRVNVAILARLGWMAKVLMLASLLVTTAAAETIMTGGKTGTYYQIGSNLRDIVAPTLEVRESKGSWANVEELSQTKGVGLAIVQSDVYSAFVYLRDSPEVPGETRRQYARLLANLRVFMPMYREEIHFLVHKDSPAEYIHQIRGARIWMDAEKSGTYLTALNIYSKMFNEPPRVVAPFVNPTVTGDDEGTRTRRSALMVLSDPSYYGDFPAMDVMVLVGGQPLGILTTNIPDNLKLLKFDITHPLSGRLMQDYRRAEIQKANYPLLNIVDSSQSSLSVDSYLITANFIDAERRQFVSELADRFCAKFNDLQARGHPKWKAMTWKPGAPLPALNAGWKYSERVSERLGRCQPAEEALPVMRSPACKPQDRFAGLCR
ncbi:MAG: TRAP-type uncharacterized transport system protein periplasmic component [Ramlibacter sp.]|jgi:hypothetical protein|nr:TRAP-type uncharacterized transport system protein periplasmic component [Ramlibacter sp.]